MATLAISRRAMLGAIALAPAIAIPVTASTGTSLIDQFDRYDSWTFRLNDNPTAPEDEWSAWEAEGTRLYSEAEQLPLTPENAAIKARAIASIHCEGGEQPWPDDDSRSGRLGRQLVRCLVPGGLI